MEEVCIDEDGWVAKREPFAVAITKMEKVRKNIQTYIAYDVKSDVSHLHFAPIPTTPITPAFLCWSAVPKILVIVCVWGGGGGGGTSLPRSFRCCFGLVPTVFPSLPLSGVSSRRMWCRGGISISSGSSRGSWRSIPSWSCLCFLISRYRVDSRPSSSSSGRRSLSGSSAASSPIRFCGIASSFTTSSQPRIPRTGKRGRGRRKC